MFSGPRVFEPARLGGGGPQGAAAPRGEEDAWAGVGGQRGEAGSARAPGPRARPGEDAGATEGWGPRVRHREARRAADRYCGRSQSRRGGRRARHGQDAGAAGGDRGPRNRLAEELAPRTRARGPRPGTGRTREPQAGTGQQVGRERGPGSGVGRQGRGADGDRKAEAAGVPGRSELGARGGGHAGGRGPGSRRRPPKAAPAEREARGGGVASARGWAAAEGRPRRAAQGRSVLTGAPRAPDPTWRGEGWGFAVPTWSARRLSPRGSADALGPHLTAAPSFIAGSRPPPTGERRPQAPPRAAPIGSCGSAWPCCYPAPEAEARACAMGPCRRLLRVLSGCGGGGARANPRARCGAVSARGRARCAYLRAWGGAAQGREPAGGPAATPPLGSADPAPPQCPRPRLLPGATRASVYPWSPCAPRSSVPRRAAQAFSAYGQLDGPDPRAGRSSAGARWHAGVRLLRERGCGGQRAGLGCRVGVALFFV